MRRLSSEEREDIISLRKAGKSLSQICRSLSIEAKNKPTVYYHLRKNFGRRYKLIKLDCSNQNFIGEIIGLFASDGDAVPQSDYQVRFHLSANEENYAKSFITILYHVFKKRPHIYKTKRNSLVLSYTSKIMYEFIKEYLEWNGKKTYTVKLKSLNHSKEFLIGFLRGYFDGDGYSKDDQRLAQFITTSKSMYDQLQEILTSFKFEFYKRVYQDRRENRHMSYYIFLRKLEAVKFINLIEPRNSKRVKVWARGIAWSSMRKA